MASTIVRTFVDTNVFVYSVDDSEPAKRDQARLVLQEIAPEDLCLSSQVLAEFYVVVTRKLAKPMRPQDAAAAVTELSRLKPVPVTAQLVNEAVGLSRKAKLSLWDAMIVRAAAAGRCRQIVTEDLAEGTVLDGIQIVSPFPPST